MANSDQQLGPGPATTITANLTADTVWTDSLRMEQRKYLLEENLSFEMDLITARH